MIGPLQPMTIKWDQGPSGTTSYDLYVNDKKMSSTKTALSAKFTLNSGDTVKVVSRPSGQAQSTKVVWGSNIDAPVVTPPIRPTTPPSGIPASHTFVDSFDDGKLDIGMWTVIGA